MGCPQGKGKRASWSLFHQHPAPSCPKLEVASPAQSNRLAAVPATAGMCLGRCKRRERGAGGLARWVSAASGARSQLPPGSRVKQNWETKARKGERPGRGASASRWDPSFIAARRSRWLAALCQLPEQQRSNTGLTYSYVLCKSKELQTSNPPRQACQSATFELYEDSCRQSAACASNSHQAGQRHCEPCCLISGHLLPTQIRPWKRVSAPPNRPCRAPTPKNTTGTKAVNSCSEHSPWQRAAPRCAISRSRR